MGVAVASGLIAGFVSLILLMAVARPWAGLGAVLACVTVGFFTLLIKYPRWEADI
jgi:presenilin-like A22 family membrane protease